MYQKTNTVKKTIKPGYYGIPAIILAATFLFCGNACPAQSPDSKGINKNPSLPDDPRVKALCPKGFQNGVYQLKSVWTASLEVVYNNGISGLDGDEFRKIRFDSIGVTTNKHKHGLYHGLVWLARSLGSNSYSSIYAYRSIFPADTEIKKCTNSLQTFELLGPQTGLNDGYGAHWALFRMHSEEKMELLTVYAFWMAGEKLVRHITISRGFASPVYTNQPPGKK